MLHRAIVSLPVQLLVKAECYLERVVFFEATCGMETLSIEALLSLVWGVDAGEWCEQGAIYNIKSERDLLDDCLGDKSTGDLRLLEIAWGGERPIHYVTPERVDLFVTPRNRRRLDAALASAATVMSEVAA